MRKINEILTTMGDKPIVKLDPIKSKRKRKLGLLKGKVKVAKDFDEPIELHV